MGQSDPREGATDEDARDPGRPEAGAGAGARSRAGGRRHPAARARPEARRGEAMTRAILACLVAAAVVAGAAAAAPRAPSVLQHDVDALGAAGAPRAILLVRDGDTTTRLTAGVGEIATKTPMNAADRYRIASLTKTYVAAVVLQLAGEGKLRLTDTVERWLPGLVPNGDRITIRELLTHTSGLADHEKDPVVLAPYLKGNLAYYWSPRRLVEIAVSRTPHFPPGETKVASYSSTNYVLAGLIVRRVTGHSIGDE